MKHRQLKKLCKKAYDLMMTPSVSKTLCIDLNELAFDHDENLHVQWFCCSSDCEEYDMRTAWDLLSEMYFLSFTDYTEHEMVFTGKPPTPSNVFNWARNL